MHIKIKKSIIAITGCFRNRYIKNHPFKTVHFFNRETTTKNTLN